MNLHTIAVPQLAIGSKELITMADQVVRKLKKILTQTVAETSIDHRPKKEFSIAGSLYRTSFYIREFVAKSSQYQYGESTNA